MNPTPETRAELYSAAKRLAAALSRSDQKIVFAESCTAGLVPATLASIPGISQYLCGSAVTYRNDTKHRWLSVGDDVLSEPGPVSEIVAKQMAAGALKLTPEADLAASITGHLGPDAPEGLDGVVHTGVAFRSGLLVADQYCLAPAGASGRELRIERQYLAARLLIDAAAAAIGTP